MCIQNTNNWEFVLLLRSKTSSSYPGFHRQGSNSKNETNRLLITSFGYKSQLCCCSVTPLCSTLCDPMDCSIPGLPVLHYLPELAQTRIDWVSNASQPSHPLSSPSPPAFNLCQLQGFFQWVNTSDCQSIGAWASASALLMNIQGQCPLGWTGWISLQSKGLSRVFSNTVVQKHQFFGAQPSLWSNSHICTWYWKASLGETI